MCGWKIISLLIQVISSGNILYMWLLFILSASFERRESGCEVYSLRVGYFT